MEIIFLSGVSTFLMLVVQLIGYGMDRLHEALTRSHVRPRTSVLRTIAKPSSESSVQYDRAA